MALCEVVEGDNGGLLVLGWIMRDDFLGTVAVFGCEFEGKLRTGWVSERQEEEERKKQSTWQKDNCAGILKNIN